MNKCNNLVKELIGFSFTVIFNNFKTNSDFRNKKALFISNIMSYNRTYRTLLKYYEQPN